MEEEDKNLSLILGANVFPVIWQQPNLGLFFRFTHRDNCYRNPLIEKGICRYILSNQNPTYPIELVYMDPPAEVSISIGCLLLVVGVAGGGVGSGEGGACMVEVIAVMSTLPGEGNRSP